MQRQEAVDLKFKNAFYAYFAINRYKEDQLQLKHNVFHPPFCINIVKNEHIHIH